MRRNLCLVLLLAIAPLPALARDGLFVWNDTRDLAVKLVTLNPGNPAEAKSLVVLEPLKTYSETMTAVASDGAAIGLCHHLLDGNEAPASLIGFDAKGRRKWELRPKALHAAIQSALPTGYELVSDENWLTFSCVNGGATGRSGELAFDIGVSAGRPEPDGRVISDKSRGFEVRLHVSGKSGKLLAIALRDGGGLELGRNPPDRMQRVAGGGVIYDPGATFIFPESGEGRVMWGAEPIRWRGVAVVEGHDFAWWLPPAR